MYIHILLIQGFVETATKFSLEFRVYSARIKLWTVIFHVVETQLSGTNIYIWSIPREEWEENITRCINAPVFVLPRLKQNLVAESFSPATLFASRQRSGPREVERDSRVGKLFLANSICQMETKRYSGIALNNTALLLPAESLSLSLFSSSLSISTLEFLDQGGIRTKASLLFRILINIWKYTSWRNVFNKYF